MFTEPEPEPECEKVRQWREEFRERVERKDAEEIEANERLRVEARERLEVSAFIQLYRIAADFVASTKGNFSWRNNEIPLYLYQLSLVELW